MKTLIIPILVMIVSILFLANTTIGFKPFKFSMEKPYHAVGWVLIILGVIIIQLGAERLQAKRWSEKLIPLEEQANKNVEQSKKLLEKIKTKANTQSPLDTIMASKKSNN